jgi:hypothetical protein
MNPWGGFKSRKRGGTAEGPVRAGVVPNGSLKGMRRSENGKMPERTWARKSEK